MGQERGWFAEQPGKACLVSLHLNKGQVKRGRKLTFGGRRFQVQRTAKAKVLRWSMHHIFEKREDHRGWSRRGEWEEMRSRM